MRATDFTVTVNGVPVDVVHAAVNYDYVNFDITGKVKVEITAAEPGFWDRGVDIEPWRLDIRPERQGQTIRFELNGPTKLAISRPRDFLNHAHMLFVFAGTPPPPPPPAAPNVHVYAPGVYHQSLNPQSGDIYYLSPGAYFFGSLNVWNAHDVKVLGRGTIVYEGIQDPNTDQGWMQKKDWHCIGAKDASNVEIDGVTCIVRARTWSVQMKDTYGFTYDDLRVMGGNPGNANQDGMDWLGGGDALVRNSFLRASDDDLAMQGNWDGYTEADMLRPGHDVQNIRVENTELSTSISNIVRSAWPQKTFNSRDFTLRNSDILHAGIGACGQTFALLGFWGAKGASGDHANYRFENLFLDNWYSLLQVEQEKPEVHGFTFRNIWALGQPPLAESTLKGQVQGVTFDNVKYGQTQVTTDAQMPLAVSDGAGQPYFTPSHRPVAAFTVKQTAIRPRQKVTFTAQKWPHAHYTWRFGDGAESHQQRVKHRFRDALGTELDGADGAGSYRVLLHVVDDSGHEDWAEQDVVVVDRWHDAAAASGTAQPGLAWSIYPGSWPELPNMAGMAPQFTGVSPNLQADAHGAKTYVTAWDGMINVPSDGGYTFHLMARDGARLVIDGVQVAKTGPPFPQVCGSPGNAVRYDRGSIGLRAGLHRFHLEDLHSASQGEPRVLWQGPGLTLADVPASAYSHASTGQVAGQ
jgi:hypothetical protein